MGPVRTAVLLERDASVSQLEALVTKIEAGDGGVLVIESPAGTGKTALVQAGAELARQAGITVLQSRGSELEREFGFGLVRQLFERTVARATPEGRQAMLDGPARTSAAVIAGEPSGEGGSPTPGAVIHGLYWLTENLAALEPLLLIVDDVHWADAPSWQWLRYMAGRVDGLPVGLLVAGRSETTEGSDHRGSELARSRDEQPLELEALSEEAVQRLVLTQCGEGAEDAFVRACHELTGGNPFLVIELLKAVQAEVILPLGSSAEALRRLSLDRVGWSVRARITRLAPPAAELARVLAVLDDGLLSEIAALSGLDPESTTHGVDSLVGAQLVSAEPRLHFVHPLVRSALYDEIPPATRSTLHLRAAEHIQAAAGDPDRVAGHLLQVAPGAEPWVAAALLDAAMRASARGAPTSAVSYLRRAEQEQVPMALRATILGQLGLAEEKLRLPESIEHLEAAIAGDADPVSTVPLARTLGRALSLEGRVADGVAVLERAINRLPPERTDLRWPLELELQALGRAAPETLEATNQRLAVLMELAPEDPELQRRLDRFMVIAPCWMPTDWREAERRATEALEDEGNPFEPDPDSMDHYQAVQALGWCDLYDQALRLLDLAFAAATTHASMTAFVLASSYRANVQLRRGAFAEAEADARAALELIGEHRLQVLGALSFSWLTIALLERDKLDDAWTALAEQGFDGQIPDQNIFGFLYGARAMLRLAGHEPDLARRDAQAAGRLLVQVGPGPAPIEWRATAALAAHACGELEEGRRLAAENLGLARQFGAPRTLGIALRTAGLVGAEDPLPMLRASVDVLQASGARGELARSLVELGTALRRRRQPAEATRAILREALDISHRCGARRIEQRARDELLAAGGRPRRPSIRGRDALTARELRVGELAAGGATNRQIAQTLFVTPRTIEHHLRSVYSKLGIRSRTELSDALDASADRLPGGTHRGLKMSSPQLAPQEAPCRD